jgi:alcohol dehydrogenase class IV
VTNVHDPDGPGPATRVERLLADASLRAHRFEVRGEPEIGDVDQGLKAARAARCDVIVGVGGGSAIDAAKAIAGLLTNGGACLDYMEVIGAGQPIREPAAPWIAVPTTAGTGAEVTRNAVIGSKERAYKASIRSPLLLPRVALVDAELAAGLPPEVTARTGMDALTQCIESYTSSGANAFTDPLALQGVALAGRSLRRAFEHGGDVDAREPMALAALISGITLSHAGLGAVHGFAAPAGARYPVPHGTVCAALLPHVMRANIDAARGADAAHPLLARYAEVGRALAGDRLLEDGAAVETAVDLAGGLARDLRIPGLGEYGLEEQGIPGLVEMARRASSMKYNPLELPPDTLAGILRAAL